MKRIIYQVLTRLWGSGRFSAWGDAEFEYMRSLGVDYIWFTGVPRHASGKPFVKGDPGCPYSISDWMDVNPYLADDPDRRIDEFRELAGRVHAAGLKLIVDYIPNHVACDYDGSIEHYDWHDGDWSDTLKVNWHSAATRRAMRDVLLFWAGLGVDGFRCDMVELVDSSALGDLISVVRGQYPNLLFIAEAYNIANYRDYLKAGFDLLYDKCGLYDTLRAISCHGASARGITANWQSLQDMQPCMLNFLENHDEQRVASPFFMGGARRSYAALALSLLFNDASFMLYFGQEAAEDAAEGSEGRTSIFSWAEPVAASLLAREIHEGRPCLDGEQRAVLTRYRELLGLAGTDLFRSGACWDLCYCNTDSPGFDPDRHFAFMRYDGQGRWAVVACNFSDEPAGLRIRIPQELRHICDRPELSLSVPAWDAAAALSL